MVDDHPSIEVRPVRVALSDDYELTLLGLAEMLARYPSPSSTTVRSASPLMVSAVRHSTELWNGNSSTPQTS